MIFWIDSMAAIPDADLNGIVESAAFKRMLNARKIKGAGEYEKMRKIQPWRMGACAHQ